MSKQAFEETIRAFLAVNLPPPAMEAIGDFQERIAPKVEGIRWSQPQNCHLTLKFLGDRPLADLPRIKECLTPITHEMDGFDLELYGVGQFPPKGTPSVVWIGVRGGYSPLLALEQRIREALLEAQIGFDKKTFKPHITIGRANRKPKPRSRALSEYAEHSFGIFRVEGFLLMQSVLQPEGPVYSERLHFPLDSVA